MHPRTFARLLLWLAIWLPCALLAAAPAPVLIGLDAEFGLDKSTSAQAIERGLRIAMAEINANGGVLGGRKLELVTRDHRSMPARGIKNIEEFAALPDLVAVFGGRFSPVVIEELPRIKETRTLFMAVWSSADPVVDNGMQPNYVYRLSLRDGLAMPRMLKEAEQRGLRRVGLLLTNTSWGRSNQAAAQRHAENHAAPRIVATAWYNWTEKSLLDAYTKLTKAGAEAVILVANDDEGALLVKEMAALPKAQRVPILSHWGITGGEFFAMAGPALSEVDFSVIQTFSFFQADPAAIAKFLQAARPFGIERIEDIYSPVGTAHAYDAMHILAKAIDLAGSTQHAAVRDALEQVRNHRGLIKFYARPFAPGHHEALDEQQLLMARYRKDGVLVPAQR